MARTAIPVDRTLFEQAVQQAEVNGPLSTQSELFVAVAEKYNALAPNPISSAVAKLRIEGWELVIKTAKARIFKKGNKEETEKSVVPEPAKKSAPPIEDDAPKGVSVEMQRRRSATGSCGCGFMSIIAPAGWCPVKLTGTDEESVKVWARKVVEAGHKIQRHFTLVALKYWVSQFYERGEDRRTICQHLTSIYDTDVFQSWQDVRSYEPTKKASIVLEEESLDEVAVVEKPKKAAEVAVSAIELGEKFELGEESIDF